MNTKRGFAPIVIGLILTAILVGGFVAYKNSQNKKLETSEVVEKQNKINDETKDWKTYRNEKYGFEFKYPFEAIITGNDYGLDVPSPSWVTVYSEDLGPQLFNIQERSLGGSSLRSYVESLWNLNIKDNLINTTSKKVGPLEKIIVAGKSAYSFTVTYGFTSNKNGGGFLLEPRTAEYTFVYMPHNNDGYYLAWYQTNEPVQSRIFATLKFIK